MKDIEIKSNRFQLKSLVAEDATIEYLSWLDESFAKKFITYADKKRSLDDLREYIVDKNSNENVLFLGIFLKEGMLHIGNIKYEPFDREKGYAIMGIMIGNKKWHGKGVAPEVICESARWLRSREKINQIILGVNVENSRAIKSYEKIGFVKKYTPYIEVISKEHITMVWDL